MPQIRYCDSLGENMKMSSIRSRASIPDQFVESRRVKEVVAAPVYKSEINDRGNPLRWPRDTLYPQKLALTSPKSGGRSVGIVRSRTKAMEFSFLV
jgi:hypothetical protein